MKKIKVLQLLEGLEIGGMERIAATIACNIDQNKYEMSVWSIARGGSIAEELHRKGKNVKVLGIHTYYNPLNVLKLTALMRKNKFDIIHTHGYFASTMGRMAAKLAKIPVIITHVHSTYWNYTKRNIFIEKQLSKFTDRIICCSDAVKKFVRDNENINGKKIVTLYNGVSREDAAAYDSFSCRETLGIRENDILVTTVGSLFPHKGQRYLLEAISLVRQKHSNVRCFVIGDGPLMTELENYSISMGIGANVNFMGKMSDISKILSAADIFVLPSCEREGMPNAILEAMAYGKPVIASRIGGVPEVVVDETTGYLVEPKDTEGIARAIGGLIEDGDKRIALGNEGKKVFDEKFDAKYMISKIDDLYVELLASKKR